MVTSIMWGVAENGLFHVGLCVTVTGYVHSHVDLSRACCCMLSALIKRHRNEDYKLIHKS